MQYEKSDGFIVAMMVRPMIHRTCAAWIFAIQAMNIPIPWGTSGHMVGAALAAIILGSPFAAVLLLTLVLVVQGFFSGMGALSEVLLDSIHIMP